MVFISTMPIIQLMGECLNGFQINDANYTVLVSPTWRTRHTPRQECPVSPEKEITNNCKYEFVQSNTVIVIVIDMFFGMIWWESLFINHWLINKLTS